MSDSKFCGFTQRQQQKQQQQQKDRHWRRMGMRKSASGDKCTAATTSSNTRRIYFSVATIRRVCIAGVVVAVFQSLVLFPKREATTVPATSASEDLLRSFVGVVHLDRSNNNNNKNKITNKHFQSVQSLASTDDLKDDEKAVVTTIELPTHSLHDGQNITWIADMWIPPRGSRMYSAREMRHFFANFSMLFLGDSTTRRAYATLYAILNSTDRHVGLDAVDHDSVLDFGKRGAPVVSTSDHCSAWLNNNNSFISSGSVCRPMPFSHKMKKKMDLISAPCFSEVNNVLKYDMANNGIITKTYDIIVFSSGLWDVSEYKRFLCGSGKGYPDVVFRKHNDTMELFQKLQSESLAIVYRTTGYHYRNFETKTMMALNKKTVNDIEAFQQSNRERIGHDGNLSYIDWGTPMLPRSIKEERIPGNNDYHYGLKARLLFLQQLMNHLLLKHHEWLR